MNNYQYEVAIEFERYQSLTMDTQREAFWHTITERADNLPEEQQLQFQRAIREQIDQTLSRMESIAQLLAPHQKSIAA